MPGQVDWQARSFRTHRATSSTLRQPTCRKPLTAWSALLSLQPCANAYPIAATTWALVHVDEGDANKAAALVSFLWWATHDGQSYSDPLSYAPLPSSLVARVEVQLKKVNCGSGKCIK